MGEFSGGCWGAGAFADTDLSLNPAWLLQCFKLKKFNFKELFQSESTLRWNAKHHHQSRWKEFFRLTRPGALTNWRLMQDAQPQTTHPSYTLQRSCPVTKKKSSLMHAPSFCRRGARTGRTEHPKATPALLEERKTGSTSGLQYYSIYGAQATVLSSSPPGDEGPEDHVYYSREGEPQTAGDIEGRTDLSGSGWFELADSCCSQRLIYSQGISDTQEKFFLSAM